MKRSANHAFCTRTEPSLLARPLVRIRFLRTVRLPGAERRSLGLQPGVGYTEAEIDRARFYRAMEQVISREVRRAKLTPLQQIGFDGRSPRVEYHPLPGENMNRKLPRNVNSSPLDYLFFQSKKPLPLWAWATGKRFLYDYRRSRSDVPVTVNFDPLDLFRVDRTRRRKSDPVQTFRPKSGRRAPTIPTIHDSRLDAIARLGRLAAEISKCSFWLLEHVIGEEWTLREAAARLAADERYIAERFREALTEAAGFYRMGPSCARGRRMRTGGTP